jgi:hypothetical protein
MKYVLTILSMVSCVLLLEACNGSQGPAVKLFISTPARGGMYRAQSGELIPYVDSGGYLAMTPTDAEALLNYCLGPQGVSLNSPAVQEKIKQITANGY